VKDLYLAQDIGTYDAAVITRDDDGTVHVDKDELATRHGAWNGAAVGAVLGILFPPALIATAVVGAAIGGVSGHLWKGLSRTDGKELGEVIDDGRAALLVVGRGTLQRGLDTVDLNAEKSVTKQLDVDSADIDAAIRQATDEIG
jgi:uncharacterized membrane protein